MSKELTSLEVLEELKRFLSTSKKFEGVDKSFVNGSLNIIEKSLKALEIIRKIINPDFPEYKQNETISKEEYDLLKEVLL